VPFKKIRDNFVDHLGMRHRSHVTQLAAPNYRLADFFTAFPFDTEDQALFRKGAGLVGLK
jgi:hypothetical protein